MTLSRIRRGSKPTIRRVVIAGAVLFALINLVSGLARGGATQPVPATDAEIEQFLAEQIRDAGYPGAAFAIVRDGRVSHSGAVGRSDDSGRPVTSRTPFVIGSLSKAITATAIMQLVEAGRVDLDERVTAYLRDFAVAGTGARTITVRQLLHQTSGLPTLAGIAPLSGPVTDLETQVAALRSVTLASTPGTTFAYSNANYAVLGLVVERVTGRSFGDYVSTEIFERLSMRNSHTDLEEATADGLTDAHRFWFGISSSGEPFWRPDFQPAGWLIASAEDLGRFVAANLPPERAAGGRLLSPESIELMHHGAVLAGRSSYGMGWFDGRVGATRVVSHSGSTTDMASAMYLAPDRGVGLVVLYNGQSLVYELLHKGEAIGEAAMARLIGEPSGGTLSLLYPAFTVAVIAMVALQVRSLVRAAVRARRGEPTVRPVFGRRSLGVAGAVWGWAVAPAFVLMGTPDMFGAPWWILLHIDLGQALAAYAVLQLLIGAVSLGATIRALVRRRVAARPSGNVEHAGRRLGA